MTDQNPPSLTQRLLRDPLSHFLALGLGLFLLFGLANDGFLRDPQKTITVTDEALTTWIQFRNKAFSPGAAAAYLAAMPADKREEMIDEYVKEEALYRRALTLGLDNNDAIIRQRLVQKMDYIALGLAGVPSRPQVAEQTLRDWFADKQDDYLAPAWATVTHIYYKSEIDAKAAHAAIMAGQDAPRGERFLYRRNYVEATQNLLADHLGAPIASHIFDDDVGADTWSAPLQSPYGWHLVKLLNRQPETLPPFEELAPQVLQDWYREQQAKARDTAVQVIVDTFDVER